MLSRRGIRVKVFKCLYAASVDPSLNLKLVKSNYRKAIQDSYDLYLFCLYALVKVTKMSVDDQENRKSKYIPSEEDKIFSDKLYRNPIIQYIESNSFFSTKAEKLGFGTKASKDFAKQIYSDFAKTDAYKQYLKSTDDQSSHLDILLELFRFCRQNEFFNDIMEEQYINWLDDKSIVVGTIKKTLKTVPVEHNVFDDFVADEEITLDFGRTLLETVFEDDDELLEVVKPVLENWDHERIAIIDMILIKMAVKEFVDFETIPVKVSLNEYVDISKIFSTPKSKEFVNGVLDKLLKQFIEENKIKKVGRGLVE